MYSRTQTMCSGGGIRHQINKSHTYSSVFSFLIPSQSLIRF